MMAVFLFFYDLHLLLIIVYCRDPSNSARMSPTPEEEEEEDEKDLESIDPTNNAEGTVNWQQARTKKGQNKKKKSEGTLDCLMA